LQVKPKHYFAIFVFLIYLFPLLPEEIKKLNSGEEALNSLDLSLSLPDAIYEFNLTTKTGSHIESYYDGILYRNSGKQFLKFARKSRQSVLRFLSLEGGKKLYAYDITTSKTYTYPEIITTPVLGTAFSFLDISGFRFLEFFKPSNERKSNYFEKPSVKFTAEPLFPLGDIGKLELLFLEENYSLIRVDYYKKNGILDKILKIKKGTIKTREKEAHGSIIKSEKNLLKKIEMTDPDSGKVYAIEFTFGDFVSKPDPSLFNLENLAIK
jgi:hypothetical protein